MQKETKDPKKETKIQIRKDRMEGQVELTRFKYLMQSVRNWWCEPQPSGGALILGPEGFWADP
jgi:hypothetical protein